MKKLLTLIAFLIFLQGSSFAQGAAGFVSITKAGKSGKDAHKGNGNIDWSDPRIQDALMGLYIPADKSGWKRMDSADVMAKFLAALDTAGNNKVDSVSLQSALSLSTLLSYNFTGKGNNASNLAPEVFLGWQEKLFSILKTFDFVVKVGPYFSSQVSIDDSSKYLPSFMTPGYVGMFANTYIEGGDRDFCYYLSPVNLGLKLLGNFPDSSKSIIQHYFSFGCGIGFKDLININMNYTIGWHNLTSQSEENFRTIFNTNKPVQYMNIWLQTKLNIENTAPLYLFVSWKGFMNGNDYSYPNSRILTVGIQKDFSFPKRKK